jgi:hypothetical protein
MSIPGCSKAWRFPVDDRWPVRLPDVLVDTVANLCHKVLNRSRLNIVLYVVVVDKQQAGRCEHCVKPRRVLDDYVGIWSHD